MPEATCAFCGATDPAPVIRRGQWHETKLGMRCPAEACKAESKRQHTEIAHAHADRRKPRKPRKRKLAYNPMDSWLPSDVTAADYGSVGYAGSRQLTMMERHRFDRAEIDYSHE